MKKRYGALAGLAALPLAACAGVPASHTSRVLAPHLGQHAPKDVRPAPYGPDDKAWQGIECGGPGAIVLWPNLAPKCRTADLTISFADFTGTEDQARAISDENGCTFRVTTDGDGVDHYWGDHCTVRVP